MADARYDPNDAGWAAIRMSPEILAACLAEAERGKTYAEGVSPEDSGAYKQAFKVKATTADIGRGGRRVAAELYNDDPAAAPLEFGNKRMPRPQRIFGRTAGFLGGAG